VIEDVALSDVVALLRRIEKKETRIMAVQDDINQAAAALTSLVNTVGTVAADLVAAEANIKAHVDALTAQGVDTTALNAAVAAVPAAATQLTSAQAGIDALESAPAAAALLRLRRPTRPRLPECARAIGRHISVPDHVIRTGLVSVLRASKGAANAAELGGRPGC
jgi:hypothetical protein